MLLHPTEIVNYKPMLFHVLIRSAEGEAVTEKSTPEAPLLRMHLHMYNYTSMQKHLNVKRR